MDPWVSWAIGAAVLGGIAAVVTTIVSQRRKRLRRRRRLRQAQLLELGGFDQDMQDLDGAFLDDDSGGF
jgi:hypothetical protein